jgi:ribosome-associated protein
MRRILLAHAAKAFFVIFINPDVAIDENEIGFDFIRASGPGGQNVNKVSTAAQLRFDVRNSASLPGEARERLTRLAGSRISGNGVLIITARRFRTQEQNRKDAINRLVVLVQQALIKPKKRHKTRPTQASMKNRIVAKLRLRSVKRLRRSKHSVEE